MSAPSPRGRSKKLDRSPPSGGHTLFETDLGKCGIAWNERGITAIAFPEKNAAATLRRLSAARSSRARILASEADAFEVSALPNDGGNQPAFVKKAIERIAKHLAGAPQRFDDLPLDTSRVPPFHVKVYVAARALGVGETVSYGELAARAGSPLASRAVGQAMAQNPFPIIVPCHRVLAANGRIGGFSSPGGVETKTHLLGLERHR